MVRLLASLLALLALPAFAATPLAIDPGHTAVIATWNHRGLSHPVARLEKVSGTIEWDAADPTHSSVSVVLPLAGWRSGDEDLDKRLKGPEFFDAAKYPEITFRSTHVERAGAQTLAVTGDLRVRDVVQRVVLKVAINKLLAQPGKPIEAGFDADVLLRRSDFALGKYVPMVSDEVAVHVTIEAHNG